MNSKPQRQQKGFELKLGKGRFGLSMARWGESVIERVSADLQKAFPDTTGLSPRNLRDMKRFYLAHTGTRQFGGSLSQKYRGTSFIDIEQRNQTLGTNWLAALGKASDSGSIVYRRRGNSPGMDSPQQQAEQI